MRVKFCTHDDFPLQDKGCKVEVIESQNHRILAREFSPEDLASSIIVCVGYLIVLLLT